MNCKDIKQNLIFLADGNLKQPLASAMKNHLAQCKHCSHVYREILETLNVIETEKQIEVDPWFAGRVEQQFINLQNKNKVSSIALRPALMYMRMIPVAASLLIALWLGVLIGKELPVQSSAQAETEEFPLTVYEELIVEGLYQESIEAFFLTNGDN